MTGQKTPTKHRSGTQAKSTERSGYSAPRILEEQAFERQVLLTCLKVDTSSAGTCYPGPSAS